MQWRDLAGIARHKLVDHWRQSEREKRDERARNLTKRVHMYTHDGIERSWKMGSRPVHVSIKFRDGSVRQRQVDISKGNPEVPMTDAELGIKFRDCARACLDLAATTAAIEGLKNVETFDKVSALTGFLRGAASPHESRGAGFTAFV